MSPSSDPCEIYRRLSDDVKRGDTHSTMIEGHRQAMMKHAARWAKSGDIGNDVRSEILYQAKNREIAAWRPLIYLIPRAAVESRLKLVPPQKRAGLAPEFTLEETLDGSEFDVIEL